MRRSKLLSYCLLLLTMQCNGMEQLFTNKEKKIKPVEAPQELKDIINYANHCKRLPPIIMCSPNTTINFIMAGIFAASVRRHIKCLRPVGLHNKNRHEIAQIFEQLAAETKEYSDNTVVITHELSSLFKIYKEANPRMVFVETEFRKYLEQLQQQGNVLIATEPDIDSLPNLLQYYFAQEPPHYTAIYLQYPHDERYPSLLRIAYDFIISNHRYYKLLDSTSGKEITQTSSLFTLANTFLMYRLTDMQAEELINSVMPLPHKKQTSTVWIKKIVQKIAKLGLCCLRCFAPATEIKYLRLECCNKIICTSCWNSTLSLLSLFTETKCPSCQSKLLSKPRVIDQTTYAVRPDLE